MEIERTAVDSAKRIVELEALRDQLREENAKLKFREERIKERFDSEERKWREEEDEIRAKCWTTEMEKRKLEIDLKVSVRRTDDGDKLKATEAEAASLKSLLEERAMKAEKQLKIEEGKILELTQSIKVLEGEKRKLGDALSQANRSQREEIDRISNESEKIVSEMAARIQVLNLERREMAEEIKRILNVKVEHEKIISEHVSKVDVLEAHNRRFETENRTLTEKIEKISNESEKKISEMADRIHVLNLEKTEMAEEIKRILNVKVEHEKINSEHVSRMEVLEGHKLRLERENRSQREEIEKISNESEKKVSEMVDRIQFLNLEMRKMAKEILNVKAEHAKINSEHVLRVEVLERDKLRLEMETRNKDQVIKGLVQKQNQCSAANKEKPEIPQRVHPVSNVGISGIPTPHNQGEKSKAGAKFPYSRLFVKRGRKAAKDPYKPKRPPSAFFVFMEEFRKIFKEKHPNNKSVAAVGKAAGEEWGKMSEADKAPYTEKAEKRKREYEKSIAAYNKKQAWREYDSAEESDKSSSEVHDVNDEEEEEEEEDSDEDDLQVLEHNGLANQVGTKRRKSGQVWTTPEKMC